MNWKQPLKPKKRIILFTLTSFFILIPKVFSASLTTDSEIYGLGSIVYIYGSAFTPGLDVSIQINNPNEVPVFIDQKVVNENGNFSTSYKIPLDSLTGTYTIYVSTSSEKSQKKFEISEKKASRIKIFLQGFESDLTVVYGTETNVTATLDVPGANFYLLRDDLEVAYGISPLSEILVLPAGIYNYTAYWEGNQEYLGDKKTNWLTVSKAMPTLNLKASPSWEVTYPTETEVFCWPDEAGVKVKLYRNGKEVLNPDRSTLGYGTYFYTCNNTETQNFTSASIEKQLKVLEKKVELFINVSTDKEKYYQGEEVKVKGWFGYTDLTPLEKEVNLKLLDPHDSLVKDENVTCSKGIYSKIFALPEDAALGTWKIIATGYGSTVRNSTTFEVLAKTPYCGDGACTGEENCETCPDCPCPQGYVCEKGVCTRPVSPTGLRYITPIAKPGCKEKGENCTFNPCCYGLVCFKGVCEVPEEKLEIIEYQKFFQILRNSLGYLEIKVKNLGNKEVYVTVELRNISDCGFSSKASKNLKEGITSIFSITFHSANVSTQTECLGIVEAKTYNFTTSKPFLLKVLAIDKYSIWKKIEKVKLRAERMSENLENFSLKGFNVSLQLELLRRAFWKIKEAEAEYKAGRYQNSLSSINEAESFLNQIELPQFKRKLNYLIFLPFLIIPLIFYFYFSKSKKKKPEEIKVPVSVKTELISLFM